MEQPRTLRLQTAKRALPEAVVELRQLFAPGRESFWSNPEEGEKKEHLGKGMLSPEPGGRKEPLQTLRLSLKAPAESQKTQQNIPIFQGLLSQGTPVFEMSPGLLPELGIFSKEQMQYVERSIGKGEEGLAILMPQLAEGLLPEGKALGDLSRKKGFRSPVCLGNPSLRKGDLPQDLAFSRKERMAVKHAEKGSMPGSANLFGGLGKLGEDLLQSLPQGLFRREILPEVEIPLLPGEHPKDKMQGKMVTEPETIEGGAADIQKRILGKSRRRRRGEDLFVGYKIFLQALPLSRVEASAKRAEKLPPLLPGITDIGAELLQGHQLFCGISKSGVALLLQSPLGGELPNLPGHPPGTFEGLGNFKQLQREQPLQKSRSLIPGKLRENELLSREKQLPRHRLRKHRRKLKQPALRGCQGAVAIFQNCMPLRRKSGLSHTLFPFRAILYIAK
jgi:hypothetical protein